MTSCMTTFHAECYKVFSSCNYIIVIVFVPNLPTRLLVLCIGNGNFIVINTMFVSHTILLCSIDRTSCKRKENSKINNPHFKRSSLYHTEKQCSIVFMSYFQIFPLPASKCHVEIKMSHFTFLWEIYGFFMQISDSSRSKTFGISVVHACYQYYCLVFMWFKVNRWSNDVRLVSSRMVNFLGE